MRVNIRPEEIRSPESEHWVAAGESGRCRRLRLERLAAAALALTLAVPSIPSGEEEKAKPPLAPGVQHERVNLILIDVVVTDKKGNSVDDLRHDEFRLWVDGHPHPIESVELQRVTLPAPEVSAKGGAPESATPATPASGPPQGRRFVIFFDALNCERGLGDRAIQAARQFLQKQLPPGDQVMIVGHGRELKVYQEFTTDQAKMLAALKVVESDPLLRYEGANSIRQNIFKLKEAEDNCEQCNYEMLEQAVQREAADLAREDRMRILRSLAALRAVVAFLHTGNTRSEVIDFSDGFPSDPSAFYGAPDTMDAHIRGHGGDDTDVRSEIMTLAREASQAQVVIHTINTQGIPPGGNFVVVRSEEGRDWGSQIESQASDTLAAFALGTGGTATRLKNNFEPALERIEKESRVSYLVTYVPEGAPDGKYHATKVEVTRKGVRIRAKEGFLWLTNEQVQERSLVAAHLSPELFHDFPVALEARSYLEGGDKAYLEFVIAVPNSSLLFVPTQGHYVAQLEAGVVLRKGLSLIVDQFSRKIEAQLKEQEFSSRGNLSLVARRQVPPGVFEAVVVVRDLGTGNIGALRVPVKVPAFSPDRIAVSSLVLESPQLRGQRVDLDPATQSDASLVIPVVQRVFSRDAQVLGTCIVYHPKRDPGTGEARVRVKGSIRQGNETVQEIADSLQTLTDSTQGLIIPLEFPLSLTALTPGVYSLEVQAMDEVGQKGIAQRVDFMVR